MSKFSQYCGRCGGIWQSALIPSERALSCASFGTPLLSIARVCLEIDTATLLCYVFLWSMVVDVKLFTIEKLYHLDHLFCSRPKLVIHCYLLKPLLIDRVIPTIPTQWSHVLFHFRRWERGGAPPPLCPVSFLRHPPPHPIPRRRRRGDQTTRATHSTTIVVQTSKLCRAWRS